MAQSPLLTVGVWQKKSAEVSFQNKDLLISAVNKGFNAMAAVLTKDSDPDEVQCALDLLNCERSIALRYDKSKDDSLRDLMYGLLESLHVSVKEWTEERKQVKETGEISTPTEESTVSLIGPLIRPCESSIPIDNILSNHLPTNLNPLPLIPTEPKEEPIDNHYSLPHDYQISASELMRDEKMLKDEEMDNENTVLVTAHSNPIFHDSLDPLDQDLNFTRSLRLNSVVHPADISQILPRDNQMTPLNALRGEMDFKEEQMPADDVMVPRDSMEEDMRLEDVENTGMVDAVNDSLNEQPFEENDSLRTIQPSAILDYQMNFDDEIFEDRDLPLAERNSLNDVSMNIKDVPEAVESEILGDRDPPLTEMNSLREVTMSIEDVVETAESEIEGENGLSANDLIDNEGEENEGVDDPTDTPKDPSDTPKNEKRRRSSRQASRPMQYNEPVEDFDGDIGPSVKKSKSDSTRKDDNKRKSSQGEEESEDVVKKRRVSKKNDTELECTECEYRSRTVTGWVIHLRKKHSTTPALSGLALLCECGKESLSDMHSLCLHGNITVIRKRDGPIRRLDDEKETPQCVLCEAYPKTARGYVFHLQDHHKSTLLKNGIYLKCSCGTELRMNNNSYSHAKECNPRQFTLHKRNEE